MGASKSSGIIEKTDQVLVRDEWQRLDEAASQRGEDFYQDPKTGYWVATTRKLKSQGKCCGSGCRHCPY